MIRGRRCGHSQPSPEMVVTCEQCVAICTLFGFCSVCVFFSDKLTTVFGFFLPSIPVTQTIPEQNKRTNVLKRVEFSFYNARTRSDERRCHNTKPGNGD
jgi:hypothetical protein